MSDNNYLKCGLILHSFSPLFLLILIKHVRIHFGKLIWNFLLLLPHDVIEAVSKAINHQSFWPIILCLICLLWLIVSVVIYFGFSSIQRSGFRSAGETVLVGQEHHEAGVSFLVSFVLPLMIDDVTDFSSFIFFITLLCMVVALLVRTNLFYQNPILTLLNYRVFTFKFVNPNTDLCVDENAEFIGITRGKPIDENLVIKRKFIANDVFLIYNE